jgi:hypothetical protein
MTHRRDRYEIRRDRERLARRLTFWIVGPLLGLAVLELLRLAG